MDAIEAQPAQAAPGWLALASSGPVVRRALGYMVFVGSLLVAINHGDALLRGDIDGMRVVKMILTPLVPYAVSTLSSVSAIRASGVGAAGSAGRSTSGTES